MQANEKQSKFDIPFDKLSYLMNSCKEIQNQLFLFTRRGRLRGSKKKLKPDIGPLEKPDPKY